MFMPKLLLRQAFQHHFKYTECVILSLQQKSLLDSMDSQAKISTFFQPLRKRPSEEGNIEIKVVSPVVVLVSLVVVVLVVVVAQ